MKVGQGPPGWQPQPKTPLQWHQKWTTEKRMSVPTRSGRLAFVELERIDVPVDLLGDPDLVMTSSSGKRFYVQFRKGAAFSPLDLPTLVFPANEGPARAFWVLPAR